MALICLGCDLARRWKARCLVPTLRPGVLEESIDFIAGSQIDSPDETYLPPELIGEGVLTPAHLFICNSSTTIVVPCHAFADPAEAFDVATFFTRLSRGPDYFDSPLDDTSADR